MTTEESWTIVLIVLPLTVGLYFLVDYLLDHWLERKIKQLKNQTPWWDETETFGRLHRALDDTAIVPKSRAHQELIDRSMIQEMDLLFDEITPLYDQEEDVPAAPFEPRPARIRPHGLDGW